MLSVGLTYFHGTCKAIDADTLLREGIRPPPPIGKGFLAPVPGRVYLTRQARGFLEKLRKETDKFNARIVIGIQRNQLETTSDALLAMKRNLLAMSEETILAESESADTAKQAKRRKKRPAEQRQISSR